MATWDALIDSWKFSDFPTIIDDNDSTVSVVSDFIRWVVSKIFKNSNVEFMVHNYISCLCIPSLMVLRSFANLVSMPSNNLLFVPVNFKY